MKPAAKKALLVVAAVYALVVAVMVAALIVKARPEQPGEVAARVRDRMNEVQAWAHEEDPDHIRSRPLTEAEARAILDEHLIAKGPIMGINFTLPMQCLNFAVLLLLLWGIAWDPLLRMLDSRRQRVREQLEHAANSVEEAGELLRQRREELDQLRQDRQQIINHAEELGQEERREIVERARREAERIMQEARDRLREEARRAQAALREEVADIAVRIAAEVVRREITPEDHARLIQEVTAGLAAEEGAE
jgi:F-type H+-transporting ATPase subunit b